MLKLFTVVKLLELFDSKAISIEFQAGNWVASTQAFHAGFFSAAMEGLGSRLGNGCLYHSAKLISANTKKIKHT